MTDAELAILSIVAEGPIHGYDIQTLIIQRGLRAWTNIGVSSMYYVLEKLERQGLVESKGAKASEGASRRQYQITPAGFGVLQTSVADLISTPREHASGFQLGLANLYVLRPAQIRTAFTAYRQELSSRLSQAKSRWKQFREARAPFNVDAMFGHQVAMLEAELAWITAFIAEWETQAPPEQPETMPEPGDIPRIKQVVLPHDPDSPHRAPTKVGPAPQHAEPAPASNPSPAAAAPSQPTMVNKSTPPRVVPDADATPPPDAASDSDTPDTPPEDAR